MSRAARPDDVDDICAALSETEFGITWGDVPTWKVPAGAKGRGFVKYRPAHPTATDPVTGEMWDDVLVIEVPGPAQKAELVEDPDLPFFTIDHFRNTNAVLVRASDLGEVQFDELKEIITDAWACRAPKRLVKEYFADG